MSSSSWGTTTAVQLPTDPAFGYDYRLVYLNLTTGVRTGVGNERAVRDEIERLVATGGAFDGCTRENDLMTDYEKVAKIWAWINSNTKFCTCTDSAYGIFLYQDASGFRGTSFAHAEAFWLLPERAGIASRYVSGKMANYGEGRAWNWVKIADEWYFSDSCYGKNADGTVMLKGFQDATAPSYLIDASFDDASFETTKAATDFLFSAGRPTRDSGSVNARDGGTPLRWKFTDGTLTISGSGAMRDFADGTADVPWKNYLNAITTLEIEEGVAYLGENAFRNVPGLTYEACRTSLPERLGLGAYAFRDQQTAITPTPSPDPEEPAITLPEGAGDGAPFDETAQDRAPGSRPAARSFRGECGHRPHQRPDDVHGRDEYGADLLHGGQPHHRRPRCADAHRGGCIPGRRDVVGGWSAADCRNGNGGRRLSPFRDRNRADRVRGSRLGRHRNGHAAYR